MAKKPTEKQLYKLKNEWLGQFFEEVKPKEFYRAVFPEGSFERKGHFEDGKANGIITIVENDKAKNRIVFDDLSVIDEVKGAEFAVMSPVAYSGRNRTAANARWLYGIAIDLDGVEMPQLRDVFHQMNHDISLLVRILFRLFLNFSSMINLILVTFLPVLIGSNSIVISVNSLISDCAFSKTNLLKSGNLL